MRRAPVIVQGTDPQRILAVKREILDTVGNELGGHRFRPNSYSQIIDNA